MRIEVDKFTDEGMLRRACEFTMGNTRSAKGMNLKRVYGNKHSPMRTQLFEVRMYGIPSATSTHLVRHSAVGQLHFVQSNRPDRRLEATFDGPRKYTLDEWRALPIDHMMVLNAQHLQEMSWDRLCKSSSLETRKVMAGIRQQVLKVDPEIGKLMVPYCVYFGKCKEDPSPCKKV